MIASPPSNLHARPRFRRLDGWRNWSVGLVDGCVHDYLQGGRFNWLVDLIGRLIWLVDLIGWSIWLVGWFGLLVGLIGSFGDGWLGDWLLDWFVIDSLVDWSDWVTDGIDGLIKVSTLICLANYWMVVCMLDGLVDWYIDCLIAWSSWPSTADWLGSTGWSVGPPVGHLTDSLLDGQVHSSNRIGLIILLIRHAWLPNIIYIYMCVEIYRYQVYTIEFDWS